MRIEAEPQQNIGSQQTIPVIPDLQSTSSASKGHSNLMRFFEHGGSPLPAELVDEASKTASRQALPSRKARWAVGLGIPLLAVVIPGIGAKSAMDNADLVANLSRDLGGFENTQLMEGQYLHIRDLGRRKLYDWGFGPDEKPFKTPTEFVTNAPLIELPPTETQFVPSLIPSVQEQIGEVAIISLPEAPKPKPFIYPETHVLLPNPIKGEGEWSTDGLPTKKEKGEITMVKTTIRPDSARPYSNVSAIVLDSRRIRLNMVGGATDIRNGGDRGPGRVPEKDLSNLLVVMNSGFQFDHARKDFNTNAPFVWGAYLDGVEYATLQPGMGSVAVFKDGSIKMGVWGEGDLAERTEDMIAVRQNGKLMIQDGELTPAIKNEGDVFTWGKLTPNSVGTVITARSAIGMTKDGNLMVAAANDMSALSLARGLQAAGAYTAIQLDINYPWVQIGVVSDHTSNGTPIVRKFMDSMQQDGSKFLNGPQARDLMFVTLANDPQKP